MENRDSYIQVKISDDRMEARGVFLSPHGRGACMEIEEAEAILSQAGVVSGIDYEQLRLAVEACNQKGHTPAEYCIARGRVPEDADPAYLKLAQKLFHTRLYGKEKGGRVDFHEASPFIIVSQGESLARFQPAADGIPGETVTGEPVAPGIKKRIPFEPGENTYREGEYIKASIAGRFVFEGVRFRVSPVLEISAVDFSTGNIRYPGDILLTGEISDGFSLSCGGDLHSTVPLAVSDIRVKGNLFVEGGLLGRGKGLLKVGGNISARFVENVYLECRGSLHVEGGILHSSVYSLGTVNCGEKGKIFNADVHALAGVEALQLGNSAGQKTSISAGTDFRRLRSYRERKKTLRALQLKADTLASMKQAALLSPGSQGSLDELIRRTQRTIEEIRSAAEDDLRGIRGNGEAKIISRDTVYPGVTLEICQVLRRVTTSVPRGTFFLDPEKNRVELNDG